MFDYLTNCMDYYVGLHRVIRRNDFVSIELTTMLEKCRRRLVGVAIVSHQRHRRETLRCTEYFGAELHSACVVENL